MISAYVLNLSNEKSANLSNFLSSSERENIERKTIDDVKAQLGSL